VLAEHVNKALTASPRSKDVGVLVVAADGPVGGATSVRLAAVHSALSMGIGYCTSDGTSVQQGSNMMPREPAASAAAGAQGAADRERLTSFAFTTEWSAAADPAAAPVEQP
jgi:hypothetical protein